MSERRTRSNVGVGSSSTEQDVNNVIANGFHSYKEGYEKLEKTSFGRRLKSLLHHTAVPLTILLVMPTLVLLLWHTLEKYDGSCLQMLSLFTDRSLISSVADVWASYPTGSPFSLGIIFGYCAWSCFWMKILPGKTVKGPVTPKRNVPIYTDNGLLHYTVTMLGFAVLTVFLKIYGLSPTVVFDRFGELLVTMNVFSVFFCLGLYIKGIVWPSSTDCGKSGNFVFDYYWGTELYPRVFGIDIKVFTNCRFGMTVWGLLVCICMLKSYEQWGFVDSIFVSTVLQLAYITKFFTWEGGYMSTIDIILDRAGFYICWGCLVYLPALYPAVSFYLVNHPVSLGPFWSSIILLLGLVSIYVNYRADLQKQEVRFSDGNCLVWGRKPDVIRATYVLDNGDVRESILLASGWWGLSRHFHYIPEILLSLFWTLPALFDNLLPYTYVIYLTILLTHRSFRDDKKCGNKYGEFWREYCQKVPHRIVPYLF